MHFQLESEYLPCGDQPRAIDELAQNLSQGVPSQVLLGATGTGKTFTMAQVVARLNRPALIMAPNKTLAAQLYSEFKGLFPHNAVEYFVSYYDYYQPEAYLPRTDTYIEKDSSINDDIDKLRHAATHSLLTRKDVLIVASVSCIYGLGSRDYYERMVLTLTVGETTGMEKVLGRLVEIQYERNDYDFHRGVFRVRGDVVELIPAYARDRALRLEFFGDELEAILETDPLTGEVLGTMEKAIIFPASHYVSDRDNLNRAVSDIREELRLRLTELRAANDLLSAQRLEMRTLQDLEMIEELGYCNGIENYSRHLDGRQAGDPPYTLLDYFPKDFILFVDESHITVSQTGAMYAGDRSRKQTLVDYGFRLPSALDNRPLNFEEFLGRIGQAVYVSATPGDWEINRSEGVVVEQIIRPTGLLDPIVEVRPTTGQMDDLMAECRVRMEAGERVLVTTLTKRMAEELNEYFNSMGVTARYLHSDIDTLERVAIIKALRQGEFAVLVGINLLREGLDIPEVSLVAILDADKEGFLRSVRSLIQTFGRASRNVAGRVILYADKITNSMRLAMDETARRREKQEASNLETGVVPRSIVKTMDSVLDSLYGQGGSSGTSYASLSVGGGGYNLGGGSPSAGSMVQEEAEAYGGLSKKGLEKKIRMLERDMREAAKALEFEKAAQVRDQVARLRQRLLEMG
ncbi:excinuclease ABC subunit UvrB [Desulfovibrio aerotolerans]|uniref:UvrABC system protein B n=1 Tax=Solidesulfovibrio aerotolerans TaxID=295255 RepID=A0A7C9IM70_9BACT|nr:excinuclease ABC subunit UvrB [Solidesulfovibrio aerotolerans]MYL84165.1 excinuclease ABC subunit UvrB [Solidesulfovibrio aerotolerans]